MTLTHRTALRAAALVHQQLAHRRHTQRDVFLPENAWARSQALLRQRDKARDRGWLLAAASVTQNLVYELGHLRSQIDHVMAVLHKQAELHPFPSQAEIFQEIISLEQEFHEVRLDLKRGDLNRLMAFSLAQVLILDMRMRDGFVLGSRIGLLATYSRGHGYKELADWAGVSCSDCGATVGHDCRTHCLGCQATYCQECLTGCEACSELYCDNCLSDCDVCHKPSCNRCLAGGVCRSCRDQSSSTQETRHASPAQVRPESAAA